ncbi:hypothetical protein [Clostridium thermarum]|uniref:hypothetical protein n=1 Tax=Clostridium thermarum TaxID=1716543 RepID=UPI0013D4C68A|nr:hypothetical protein [Clostridium thermarum]
MDILSIIIAVIIGSFLSAYLCSKTNIISSLKDKFNINSKYLKIVKLIKFMIFVLVFVGINIINKADFNGKVIVGVILILSLTFLDTVLTEIRSRIEKEDQYVNTKKTKTEFKINFCYHCGSELKEGYNKCTTCGQELDL